MTREAFLAACQAVTNAEEASRVAVALGKEPPAWARNPDDAEVAWYVWWLNGIVCSQCEAFRNETESTMAAMEDLWNQAHARWAAMNEVTGATTDDLDLFQAGYERGYAQGWQHRGTQGKEATT